MRNRNIGFVGDSLNENFVVSFLCILRVADENAKKWKKKGAWKGAYFPKFNVTVAYHRAVLLSNYKWQPKQSEAGIEEGIYRVDVDVPTDDWAKISDFYDVLVFNTGHWWNHDKFPKEKPLVFYKAGEPIVPPLGMLDGLKAVLGNMVASIQKDFPRNTLKFWRLQSPRHFYGGDWNQNGSCLFNQPLKKNEDGPNQTNDELRNIGGPMTRARAKQMDNALSLLIQDIKGTSLSSKQGSHLFHCIISHVGQEGTKVYFVQAFKPAPNSQGITLNAPNFQGLIAFKI
ncbi:unnamed protein product [Lupinus luteus]|uniref:Trichome birefringence-like C-terminal domain-containing protein n=1 Tax=Lupinus luteus TaxID=3873 RepID=A0AAV1WX42_LUPLU